jgi:transketolase
MGLVPFVHSFGCFASRRAFDQFYISVGYAHQVIHLIGSDPGVLAQYNGGTHMPFEDIGLMRQVPGVIIIDPSDKQSMYELTRQVYESGKISYTPPAGRPTPTAILSGRRRSSWARALSCPRGRTLASSPPVR